MKLNAKDVKGGFFKCANIVLDEAITAVFPIIQIQNESYKFFATGFFISAAGMFCTAKHVICDPNTSEPYQNLYAVYFHEGNQCYFRAIKSVINTSKTDICIGIIEDIRWKSNDQMVKNKVMNISTKGIENGDFVATYAYPKSSEIKREEGKWILDFNTSWHFGNVTQEFPNGRDSYMLPGHCYETNMKILGGASGAPVANEAGQIIGVNSTSFDFNDDGPNVSYISPISEIFEMKVVVEGKTYTILELAEKNLISIIK